MDRSARAQRVYVPLFWDLTGQAVLIVGGGQAAWQKVRALDPFDLSLTVLSPQFLPELRARGDEGNPRLRLQVGLWDEGILGSGPLPFGLVLACTDRPEVQAAVVSACRTRGIPVLDAADPTAGDFIQPATARHRGFTLAVSSNGTRPRGAVVVRDALQAGFQAAVQKLSD